LTLGLSTYAFFWQHSGRVGEPLSVVDMVQRTAEAGAEVLQICDYPAIETMTGDELANVRAAARSTGVALELGVRGIRAARLGEVLELSNKLGCRLVRSMIFSGSDRPTLSEATEELRSAAPRFAADDVKLALETYEQVATEDLVAVVQEVGETCVGICLDPANVVARLEDPRQIIDRTAGHVLNLHVKDFRFERQAGLVGFSLTGCLLGTGQLDLEYLYEKVRPVENGISQIVEHWLAWQGDEAVTLKTEREWTAHSLATMRQRQR
jgi:sugar phosphate isomerase/epimerase